MSDWATKQLGDLLERPLAYGVLKPGPYEEGGIPLIRIQDHKGGAINSNSFHKIPNALHQEFKRTELHCGDIIISVVGTIGRTAIIPEHLAGANVSRAFAVIGCSEEIDTAFLSHYLKSDISQSWFREQCQGNAQQVLNLGTLREYEVPIPPLPEQKKIAEILSGIDKAISIKRQARNDLTAAREAICSELMQNGDWSQEETGDLANHMTNGFVGTATPHYRERGVRYLTSKNIRRDRIDPSKMIYISEEFHMANRKSSLMVGDVLMVQSGHIGTTAVVTSDYKDCNCHALILMRFNQERLDPEYASLYFNSATGKTRLSDIFVGSTVKHVNTGDLRKFKIPVPPLGVQRDIAKRISAIDLLLGKRELQIEKLLILKQAISSDLLSGRKRVSV